MKTDDEPEIVVKFAPVYKDAESGRCYHLRSRTTPDGEEESVIQWWPCPDSPEVADALWRCYQILLSLPARAPEQNDTPED